jgi:hypothetical protein
MIQIRKILILLLAITLISGCTYPLGVKKQKTFENKFAESKNKKYKLENKTLVIPAKSKNDTEVRLGDKKATKFVPTLNISKWNKETSFSLLYTPIKMKSKKLGASEEDVIISTSTINYFDGINEVVFKEIAVSEEFPEGGYEVEYILSDKPNTNVLQFSILADNLDFAYQPPLNEEMASSTCSETECGGMYRPERIVGSYAAYYKNNVSGDYTDMGGSNYKTGKAFHIMRPKLWDANNNWVWGQMNITNNVLSITISQTFLDNATYPVTVDPTFGYNVGGETTITEGFTGYIGVNKDTTGNKRGYITSIYVYAMKYLISFDWTVKAVLYNMDNTLVANGVGAGVTVGNTNWQWKQSTFSTKPNISRNTYYYIGGVMGNVVNYGLAYLAYDSFTDGGGAEISNSYSSPNDLDFDHVNRRYSAYAVYTEYPVANIEFLE